MPEFAHPSEINTPTNNDAWKLFRIVSEFVDGFEVLSHIRPSVSIFGSARLEPDSPYYHMALELAQKLALKGFSVITGAGPGIMEAANQGAQQVQGRSAGLIIDLPFESEPNHFIDPKLRLQFRYFFIRKVMFIRYAQGFVFLPGGYGTLDELFEVLTLIQTKKIQPVPVYFVGSSYWKGLLEWIKKTVLGHGCISKEDLDLFKVTDDLDEVARGIELNYVQLKQLHCPVRKPKTTQVKAQKQKDLRTSKPKTRKRASS